MSRTPSYFEYMESKHTKALSHDNVDVPVFFRQLALADEITGNHRVLVPQAE